MHLLCGAMTLAATPSSASTSGQLPPGWATLRTPIRGLGCSPTPLCLLWRCTFSICIFKAGMMCVSMSLSVGPTVITVRPSSGESSHSAPARSSAVLVALQQSPTGLCGLAWDPHPPCAMSQVRTHANTIAWGIGVCLGSSFHIHTQPTHPGPVIRWVPNENWARVPYKATAVSHRQGVLPLRGNSGSRQPSPLRALGPSCHPA